MSRPYLPETEHGASHGNFGTYTLGFIFSILLTLMAYWVVTQGNQSSSLMVWEIVSLGVVQLLVQLVFFLHLDRESKPRWNLGIFLFAGLVVVILVGGTLWIMKNLDYHHPMSPSDSSIIKDEGIQP
jgi:cytochrome o ubiquinol oxidase operon protein cyoD